MCVRVCVGMCGGVWGLGRREGEGQMSMFHCYLQESREDLWDMFGRGGGQTVQE